MSVNEVQERYGEKVEIHFSNLHLRPRVQVNTELSHGEWNSSVVPWCSLLNEIGFFHI